MDAGGCVAGSSGDTIMVVVVVLDVVMNDGGRCSVLA